MPALGKRILLCGHRAFAAQGLGAILEADGHAVTGFSRGACSAQHSCVTGPVSEMHRNRGIGPTYDAVINYIVLQEESVERNLAYLQSLLETCRRCEVKHLIHFSSLSVYRDDVSVYTENAPTKDDPARSGPNASLKIAADRFLLRHLPPAVKLSLVRPACILGDKIPDPIGSVGWPWSSGRILVLGVAARIRPVISRDVLNRAIARLVADPPREAREVLLLVDANSPSCVEYLQACCDILGAGTGAVCLPTPFWIPSLLRRDLRNGWRAYSGRRFWRSVAQRCRQQRYKPASSERRIGFGFTCDWRQALAGKAAEQTPC
jgi:nucleoside-diphosphate-sugar epimerase